MNKEIDTGWIDQESISVEQYGGLRIRESWGGLGIGNGETGC